MLSEFGRIRLDSASEAFLSWDRAVALVSSVAGDEEPAPREKECAFSMPGTAIEAITPSAFAPPLAAWESALPELTTLPCYV
ncbi:hypothetical protein, partial [Pseudomonas aeruginosa]|uniref:hypothetical protein n=1 Tax=Pseudomonas aeruginosa TaxID=287 RepID=UPI001ABC88EC